MIFSPWISHLMTCISWILIFGSSIARSFLTKNVSSSRVICYSCMNLFGDCFTFWRVSLLGLIWLYLFLRIFFSRICSLFLEQVTVKQWLWISWKVSVSSIWSYFLTKFSNWFLWVFLSYGVWDISSFVSIFHTFQLVTSWQKTFLIFSRFWKLSFMKHVLS